MLLRTLLALAVVPAALAAVTLLWLALGHLRWAAYHRRTGDRVPPLGLFGWLRYYLATVAAVERLSWWSLWAAFRGGLRPPQGEGRGPAVLCIHGFQMNSTCMWGLRRRLEAAGRPTLAVYLGPPYREPEAYAKVLGRALRELAAADPAGKVDVVAHSMGGLVLRHLLALEPDLAAAVQRVVTLGTPHFGTAFLRIVRFGRVYRMMGRGVPWLHRLPGFADSAPEVEVTTLGSAHDMIVYPLATCHLPGARRRTVEGVSHVGLLTHPTAAAIVLEALDADPS